MKSPAGDRGKASLPGALAVARDPDSGLLTAVPAAALAPAARREKGGEKGGGEEEEGDDAFLRWRGLEDQLELVFDCGPVAGRSKPGFDELRARVAAVRLSAASSNSVAKGEPSCGGGGVGSTGAVTNNSTLQALQARMAALRRARQ